MAKLVVYNIIESPAGKCNVGANQGLGFGLTWEEVSPTRLVQATQHRRLCGIAAEHLLALNPVLKYLGLDPHVSLFISGSGQHVIQKASSTEPEFLIPRIQEEKEDFKQGGKKIQSKRLEPKEDFKQSKDNEEFYNSKYDLENACQDPTVKWPGNTEKWLANLRLRIRVKPANPAGLVQRDFCGKPSYMRNCQLLRILTAFGEGWIELVDSSCAQTQAILGSVLGPKRCSLQSQKRSSAADDFTSSLAQEASRKRKQTKSSSCSQ
ncbi:hypothetical protein VP01_2761g4 [Puccinia sorghi]|uniref:Uncharacterized protein n=1 Tax=Puccinia sorghi TaxID=27349 RepID=A0A0L6V2W5_9BASI|nr:hypothetical protein VP01_2761g4 [Puccinia sorghi]